MNSRNEFKIQTSVWINKSYSAVLKGPAVHQVQCAPGIFRRVPVAPRERVYHLRSDKGAAAGCSRHNDYPMDDLAHRFVNLSMVSKPNIKVRGCNEPFFASNLKYYPHLPQPARVRYYQTYAEIKEMMTLEKIPEEPANSEEHEILDCSKTVELPDEPIRSAPNRRYSMSRGRKGIHTDVALANIFQSAGNNLLRQPPPSIQRQFQVRDSLLSRLANRHEELHGGGLNGPRRLQPDWCPTEIDVNVTTTEPSKPDVLFFLD
ncbi:uncharacterized protein LOC108104368 isoform X1 [Drosophila eugracilis]|uniref:uncharacterized protein LOC108104368 isoform X1 n=1 Tax=Drosophila eugracilis TaxID=29029 RepID=UPI0007E843F6|nr:uncharacterized protein LOC108104368 isoform X1 [Drosophila eugracilis]